MNGTQTYVGTLVVEDCYKCHVTFGLDREHYERLRNTGESFWCPNGHSQHYTKSRLKAAQEEQERLRRQLEYARAAGQSWRDQAEAAERRRRAAKGQLTRIKNRVQNGVCPNCNRTFADLGAHMQTKHGAES